MARVRGFSSCWEIWRLRGMKGRADSEDSQFYTLGDRNGFHPGNFPSSLTQCHPLKGAETDQGAPSLCRSGAGAAGGRSRLEDRQTTGEELGSGVIGTTGLRACRDPPWTPAWSTRGGRVGPGRAPRSQSRASSLHSFRCVPFTAVWFRPACPGFVRRFGWRKLPLSWVARSSAVLGWARGSFAGF